MSRNVTIGIVVLVVLVLLGWFFTRSKPAMAPTSQITQETQAPVSTASASQAATTGAMMKEEPMVKISSTGYMPNTITIKIGQSVTWENTDSANHTVSSDPHPTHTLYPFLNLSIIKPGSTKSATFEKVGKYTYHDHLNPSNVGTVTVE